MGNINLLPQDLRKKEEKELNKLAKKTRILEVPFSSGARPSPALVKDQSKKESLWTRIFGKKDKKSVVASNSQKVSGGVDGVDILAAARKQDLNFKVGIAGKTQAPREGKIVAQKGNGSEKVFSGTPVAASIKKEVKKPTEIVTVKKSGSFRLRWPTPQSKKFSTQSDAKMVPVQPTISATPQSLDNKVSKTKTQVSATRDSWWKILASLFVRQKKVIMPQTSESVAVEKSEAKGGKFSNAPKTSKSRFSINLIPEELANKKQIGRDMQILSMILAITLPSLIIYGLYVILDAYQNKIDNEIQTKQEQIIRLNKNLSTYKKAKQKNIDLQQKLLVIRDLLDNHIYWTKFFGSLEKYTLDGVYYTNFSVDTSGEFLLPAVADNYEEVAKQIIVLRQAKDFIADAKVDHVSLKSSGLAGITGVDFDIKIKLTNDAFKAVKK